MKDNSTLLPIALPLVVFAGIMPQVGSQPPLAAPTQAESANPAQPSESTSKSNIPDCLNATKNLIQYIIHHPFPRREFLIATVPDPVDSQVGWLFDGQLEAILSAIEREEPDKGKEEERPDIKPYIKYTRDRYALPWECALQAKSLIEKDPKPLSELESVARLHQTRPGIILFRNLKCQRLLVLFLVGETATRGIQKKALLKTLNYMKRFSEWGSATNRDNERQVRIMGPTFSGSVSSLRLTLEQWWKDNRMVYPGLPFKVISGSASRLSNKMYLQNPPWNKAKGGPLIEFHATVVPEESVLRGVSPSWGRTPCLGRSYRIVG
jgi:hypothetical protein